MKKIINFIQFKYIEKHNIKIYSKVVFKIVYARNILKIFSDLK